MPDARPWGVVQDADDAGPRLIATVARLRGIELWVTPIGGPPCVAPVYQDGQSAIANITSDALITAVTSEPSARPSSRTASTVI